MSYSKSCNVDVVKTFDLRVRAQDNFSPGLYSTLAAGPQEVYGSPLTWEYILLLSDVQNIKNIHSTLISSSFSSLSANILYVSSYLDYNFKFVSTTLLSQYNIAENSNVYLQGTLLYDVSNFYHTVNQTLKYPSTLSTITQNFSTISTYIYLLEPTLTTLSTTSTLFYYGKSTIITLNSFIQPSISTISSQLPVYSNLLPLYLAQEVSDVYSTVRISVCNYLANQSTTFNTTFSTLQTISTFLLNTYSTQYQVYSTVNDTFYGQQLSILQAQLSSFSTNLGEQFSSVDYLYNNVMLSTISVSTWSITSNISTTFQPFATSVFSTFSTLLNTISTDQGSQQLNNSILGNIYGYDNFINGLSTGVGVLYFYSTIARPQIYYTMNFLFNDVPISTFYYPSTLDQTNLAINSNLAYNLLQDQVTVNTPALTALFASNTYNAYYNIIKAYRSNGIPLIDTLCNLVFQPDFISTFGRPANVSTAFSQYSTQVRSSILQSYKIVLQSERQSIQNTRVTFTTLSTDTLSISNLVSRSFNSLSNEMRLSTITTFNNLLNNTFRSYRSNSEVTTQILNQAEASNYVVMSNSFNTLKDHTLQDALYRDISTLFAYNFLTSKEILTSTSFGLLNLDSTTTINYSTISSLSTYYFTSISSFQSSIFGMTFSSLLASYQDTSGFNDSTISTQLSYLDPVASSIALYFSGDLFSTLSTNIQDRNDDLSNIILSVSNTLQLSTNTLSNQIDTYIYGQSNGLINLIGDCNTTVSRFFSTIFSNSISLYSDQVITSSFTTLSSIFFKAPLVSFEAGANLTTISRSPLEMTHYDGKGRHNVLFVNSTVNEVLVNSVKISGFLSTILSNTISSINLDINKYQNFLVDIRTMSNASPTIELNVNLSTLSKHTQEGNINITISPASANEIAAGRYLNILNLGPTIRLNITKLYGFLKYKYLTINDKAFLSQTNSFTKTTSSVLAAGNVTTITQVFSSDFIGIVTDSFNNLFITNNATNSIFKYNYITGELKEFVNGINIPYNLTIDSSNTLYTVSFADNLVYLITTDGVATPLELVDSNNDPFIIQSPVGIAVDNNAAYLYVSSLVTCIIYQINLVTFETIPLVGFQPGYADGVGEDARFGLVFGMTVDSDGTLYVSDFANNSIRRIVINTKTVTTLFGPLPTDGSAGTAGNSIIYNNGIPTSDPNLPEPQGNDALFKKPTGLVADNLGNLFVCDSGNFAIRRLNINTIQVLTISGKQNGGYVDGPIFSAGYTQIQGIAINNEKTNFFVCDFTRIRQVGYNINAITGNSAATIVQNTLTEAATRYGVTLYGPLPYIYEQPTNFRGIVVGDNLNYPKRTYTLTAAQADGSKIKYTSSVSNNLVSGQFISITGFTSSSYNIKGLITVVDSTHFTIKSSVSSGSVVETATATTYFPLVSMQTYRDIATNQCVIYQFDVENEVLSTFVSIPSVLGLGMCIDLNTNTLYTINQTTGFPSTITSLVYKITSDGTVTLIASFFKKGLKSITINSDGTKLYVSTYNTIYEIDLATAYTAVFNSTRNDQSWTCPTGVTSVNVLLLGGASGCYGDYTYSGTSGGLVSGTLAVTPGQTYTIIVGQGGYNSGGWWTSQGQGGYGGGGNGNGGQYGPSGGGGRSAIQIQGTGTDLVTAGGAAGSFYYTAGSVGGDPNGGGESGYQGQNGGSGGGGGGYPGGSAGKGGKSYTAGLTGTVVSTPGGALNAYHLNAGQTSDGIIILNSAAGVTLIAGDNVMGSVDGVGVAASINNLSEMTFDSSTIYFIDTNSVRKLVLSSKNITTLAGQPYDSGSANGIGRAALFYSPTDIKTDLNGTLYVLDNGNNAIRKIDVQSRIVTTLAGSIGYNIWPPTTNPDGFLNQGLLFQPTKMAFDHPVAQSLTLKDLYILDNNGLLLRGLYASYINASYPMSTIISFDSGIINQFTLLMSTVTQSINSYVIDTGVRNTNTINSYNNTVAAPPSGQKTIYVQSASNAVLDVSSLYLSTQLASSIASFDYLSLVTISTIASPQYLSSSYLANIYLSTSSNFLYDGQFQSSIAMSLNQQAKTDANNAANAAVAANLAGTTTNISQVFNWNGYDQTFTVPANVNKITVELIGGGGYGTYGGYVLGDLSTTPGTQYTIIVGIGGGNGSTGYPQLGGAGLTSGGGGIGGGRSAIQLAGTGIDIATAGGGGGITAFTPSAPNGYYFNGGNGGGPIGQSAPSGGGGGTQYAGGTAAGYGSTDGSYEQGGSGADGGGGGGGGYYGGGGGGGYNLAGGGGSSYVTNLTGIVVNLQGGAPNQSSDGQVTISYSLQIAPSGNFSPTSISNCVFWFDAADATTTLGGTNISSWGNKGSAGGYANTNVGNPISGISNINSLNSVYFPPYSGMGFQSAFGNQGDVTFFMVSAINDISGFPSAYTQLFGSKDNGFSFQETIAFDGTNYFLFPTTPTAIFFACPVYQNPPYNNLPNIPPNSLPNPFGNYQVVSYTQLSGGSGPSINKTYLDGNFITGSYNNGPAYYNVVSALYEINDSSSGLSQNVGEILLYNRILTELEITEVNTYLMNKWGTQPYRITSLAGSYTGLADGTGPAAAFQYPNGIAVLNDGNLVVIDQGNCAIRIITYPDGVVTTIAGQQQAGSVDGNGSSAYFWNPIGVVVLPDNNILVSDLDNNALRLVQYINPTTPADVTIYAGTFISAWPNFTPGNALATTNSGANGYFNQPYGLATFSLNGVQYIAVCDSGNNQIRILTYTNFSSYSDTDTVLISIPAPLGISYLQDGNFAVVCLNDNSIYLLTVTYQAYAGFSSTIYNPYPFSATATVLAGSSNVGYADGIATDALFNQPHGIYTLPTGNLIINDAKNARVRHMTYPACVVTTIAGNGQVGLVNGIGAGNSSFQENWGATSENGDIIITDSLNHTIRVVTGFPMYIYNPANFIIYGNTITSTATNNQLYSVKKTPYFVASCVLNTIPVGNIYFGVSWDPTSENMATNSYSGYGFYIYGGSNPTCFTVVNGNVWTSDFPFTLGSSLQILADGVNIYFYIVNNVTSGGPTSGYYLLASATYSQINQSLDVWFGNAADSLDNVIFTPLSYSEIGTPTITGPTIYTFEGSYNVLNMTWSAPTTGVTPDGYIINYYENGSLGLYNPITVGNVLETTFDYLNWGSIYSYDVTATYNGRQGPTTAQSNPITNKYGTDNVAQTNDITASFSQILPRAFEEQAISSAFSYDSYSSLISLSVVLPASTSVIAHDIRRFGLTSLIYAWNGFNPEYCIEIDSSTITIFETDGAYYGGTYSYSPSATFSPGDLFVIQYDGTHMTYFQNGAILYQTTTPPRGPLYAEMEFYEPNQSISGVVFINDLYYPPLPDPPTLTDPPTIAGTTLTLSWTAPIGSSITGYTLNLYENGGVDPINIYHLGNVLTYDFTAMTVGNYYTFSVATVNSAGEGIFTSQSGTVTFAAPDSPTNPVGIFQDNALVMTWTAPTTGLTVEGYSVRIYENDAAEPFSTLTLGNVLNASTTSITNGNYYTFTVAATNGAGPSSYTSASSPITYNYTLISVTQTADTTANFTSMASYNGYVSSQAYSITGYTSPVSLAFSFTDSSTVYSDVRVIGFSLAPSLESSNGEYPTYSFSILGSDSFFIHDNGSAYLVTTPCTPGDLFVIQYDGTNMNYYQNGTMVFQSTPPTGETYYADMLYYNQPQTFTGLIFENSLYYPPPPNAPTLDNPTIQDNVLTMTWSAPTTGTTPDGYIVNIYDNTSESPIDTQTLGNVLTTTYSPLTAGNTYTFDVSATANSVSGTATAQSNPITYNYTLINVTQTADTTANFTSMVSFTGNLSSQAYSITGYTNSVSLAFSTTDSSAVSFDVRYIGLSLSPSTEISSQDTPKYSLAFTSLSFYIVDNGSTYLVITPFTPGDLFVIQYDGTNMNYYQNGTMIFQSTPPSGETYYADMQYYDQPQTFTGLIFENSLYYTPPPDTPTLNAPLLQDTTLVMSWSAAMTGTTPTGYLVRIYEEGTLKDTLDVAVTSATYTSLVDNSQYQYSVAAYNTGGTGTYTSLSDYISYDYVLIDVTQTDHTTKIFSMTAPATPITSQAYSKFGYDTTITISGTLPNSSWETYDQRFLGFSLSPSSQLANELAPDYCIFRNMTDIYIIENQATVYTGDIYFGLTLDFTIQYDGTNMIYSQAGLFMYQSQPPTGQTYYAQIYFLEPNQPIEGLIFTNTLLTAAPSAPILDDPTINTTTFNMSWSLPDTSFTTITVIVYSGTSPVQTNTTYYNTTIVSDSYALQSMDIGTAMSYTVTISSAGGIVTAQSNPITYNYTLINVTQTADTTANFTSMVSYTGYISSQAYSITGYTSLVSLAFSTTDSSAVYNDVRYIGLSLSPSTEFSSQDFPKYCFLFSILSFFIVDNGSNYLLTTPFTPGDLFVIQYDGTNMNYYQNGTMIFQSTPPSGETYYADMQYYDQPQTFTGLVFENSLYYSPPNAPTLNDPTIRDTTLVMSWNAPTTGTTPDEYIVNVYEDSTLLTTLTPGNVLTTTYSTLNSGSSYTFDVSATANSVPGSATAQSNPITYNYILINMTQTADITASFTPTSGPHTGNMISQAYSLTGYGSAAILNAIIPDSTHLDYDYVIIGLSLSPSTEFSGNYFPDYCINIIPVASFFQVLDNYMSVFTGTFTPGDNFSIIYDETYNIYYLQNGELIYQSTPPNGQVYYADMQFYEPGQSCSLVSFSGY